MKNQENLTAPEIGAKSALRPPPPRRLPPKPSAKFRRRQQELRGLIERSGTQRCDSAEGRRVLRENGERRRQIEESLRAEFATAFGLTKDEYQRTKRFYWWLAGDRDWPLFDHIDYYQRGSNLVVVSQPYGDEEKLEAWCKKHGAVAWAVVDEWAHYYPGHATCLYVEFERWTPQRRRAWCKLQPEGGVR